MDNTALQRREDLNDNPKIVHAIGYVQLLTFEEISFDEVYCLVNWFEMTEYNDIRL